MRLFTPVILLITFVIWAGCSKEENPKQENVAIAPAPTHSESSETASGEIAGVQWKVPERWQVQPARTMRIATYTIPRTKGDAEDGECAVFFFGSGQGGDVRSNINRWISQFETESKPEESSTTVNGVKVTTLSIEGIYLAPGGPMMQSQGKKPKFGLLGAIVEAPEGAVFFKTTGPVATISAAEKDFSALINSIQNVPI